MHNLGWKLVHEFIAEVAPTWNNSLKSKKRASALLSFNMFVEVLGWMRFLAQTHEQRPRKSKVNETQVASNPGDDDCVDESDSSGCLAAKLQPWLQSTLAGFNNGIRRPEREAIIAVANYPSTGVVSSTRQHFLLSQVTSLCHEYPKTFLAIVVMPNRAGDLRRHAKSLGSRCLSSDQSF